MSKKSKRKKLIIWGSILVLAVLIIFGVTKGKKSGGQKVTTENVQKRTLIETVAANGKIQPKLDVKISPYISGEVIELYIKEGDEVKKGDLLAKIDPEIYKASYARMQATLNSQKANEANAKARLVQTKSQFKNAEISFNRSKKLWEQQVISDAEYESALSQYEVAEAEVDAAKESMNSAQFGVASAKASLDEAEENLVKTSIRTPNDGTVSKLSVQIGERVTGASQFSSGTEIMRIANLNEMEVNVEVNENDIVRVSLDDTCVIEVDAYLNKKFKGVVTEIATSANITGVSADQVTNFDVKILILRESYQDMIQENDPINSPFRPGMSATVDIQTEVARDVLTIPIQAVTTRADTAKTDNEAASEDQLSLRDELVEVVFLFDENKAARQEVETGIQDNKFIQIISGLEDEQEVITGPYRAISKLLKDGDEVKMVNKKELFTEND